MRVAGQRRRKPPAVAVVVGKHSETYTFLISRLASIVNSFLDLLLLSIPGAAGGGLLLFGSPIHLQQRPINTGQKDESFRCSETGYHIPIRCIKVVKVDEENEKKKQKGRILIEDSTDNEVGREVYLPYRSCIPAIDEEKLSVIGFEFCPL